MTIRNIVLYLQMNNYNKKAKIMTTKTKLLYQFLVGFLSVFGLSNPISGILKRQSPCEDVEKIGKDWINVGGDINKAYEQFKSESCQ